MATSPGCDEDETFYSEYYHNNHNHEESQSPSQQLTQQAMFPESDPSEQERFAWNAMRSPVMRQRQRAKLVHVKYGVIPLSNGSLSIGRSKQADVTIQPLSHSDPVLDAQFKSWHFLVSNMHCVLQCLNHNYPTSSGGNEVTLTDDSGNGTFVNGIRLRRGDQRVLVSGDEISLIHPRHPQLQSSIESDDGVNTYNVAAHYSFTFVCPPPTSIMFHVNRINNAAASGVGTGSSDNRSGIVDVRQMKMSQDHSAAIAHHSNPKLSKSDNSNPLTPLQVKYELLDILGKGTCGEVRRARNRQSGDMYAIKSILLPKKRGQLRIGKNRADPLIDAKREATLLRKLRHPYVIRLHESYFYPNVVHLVMDLVSGGDLFDRIVLRQRFEEGVSARRLMRRLLSAIHHLHHVHQILHRDLKPENILLVSKQNDYEIKVTDFGVAKMMDDQGLKTFCGTPQYFAPEVLSRRFTINHSGRYDFQADVWSLGVIMYIVLFGVFPFEENGSGYEVLYPSQVSISSNDKEKIKISDHAKDLIQKLLVVDPTERISVEEACFHPWFSVDDGDTHCHPLDDPLLKDVNCTENKISSGSKSPQHHVKTNMHQTQISSIAQSAISSPLSPSNDDDDDDVYVGKKVGLSSHKNNTEDDEILSDFSDDNNGVNISFPKTPPGLSRQGKYPSTSSTFTSTHGIKPDSKNPHVNNESKESASWNKVENLKDALNRNSSKRKTTQEIVKQKKKLQSTLYGGILDSKLDENIETVENDESEGQTKKTIDLEKTPNKGKQTTLSNWFKLQ